MKKAKGKNNYNYLFYPVLCLGVFLLGYTPLGNSIKYPFSYVFDPVYVFANATGKSLSNWGEALGSASSYIEEYNNMKEEIVLLKIEKTERILDYEEYKALKEHISVLNQGGKYVESKVVKFTDKGELIINKGSYDGIKVGDCVVLGRVFLGMVSEVSLNSSLIRLPTNHASNYEVVIISSTVNLNEQSKIDGFIKSIGVVTGELDGIRIENIGINSNVSDGDIVLIRDERVPEIYLLGTIVGISNNPASTQKKGVVSPIFDYSNMLTIFVKVE